MGGRRQRWREPCPLPDVPLLRAAGRILSAEVEYHVNPVQVDHVWIRIDAGLEVLVAVNTLSRRNLVAGFDPRIRVGALREYWDDLPPAGFEPCERFDYEEVEAAHNVFFEHFEQGALEEYLLGLAGDAVFLEVWGKPYRQKHDGIHQIHSRRRSCAVAEDVVGRDGGLKFYFEAGRVSVLLLLKFCGQP